MFLHLVGPLPPSKTDLSNIAYGASIEELRASCNGSYFLESGAAGHSWVFARKDGKLLCSGPGSPYGNSMSALRAELSGILSILYILFLAESRFPLKSGSVLLHNDCTEAIKHTA
jgi:hypothetical protein